MDENVLFEVEDEKHVNHMFTVPLSDLGITRKIISGVPAMEMTNLSSLPPNENPDFYPLSADSLGTCRHIYQNLVKYANVLFDWSKHVMKGAYFPVWTKINKVIDKVEDARIYTLEDDSLYARLNICLDIGLRNSQRF